LKPSQSSHRPPPAAKTALLTLVAMLAFAANPLLCRMAMGQGLIDAATFTTVRVSAGALILSLLLVPRWLRGRRASGNWRAAVMLFAYMACFSFAYLSLGAGTGTLILFGAVQLTMFISALRGGEYFALWSWAGLALAIGGLVYLLSPGVTAPDTTGALLMMVAGIAWGLYSVLGRGIADPLEATAANFIYAVPLVILVSLVFRADFQASREGYLLAIASGAATSGLGYAIWYAALKGLSGIRAATVQLSVPVIAAFGGVVLLSEDITWRLVIASAATLGGVAIVLAQRAVR
jgi:drug/metabolite transporter (DMT)-like permease